MLFDLVLNFETQSVSQILELIYSDTGLVLACVLI